MGPAPREQGSRKIQLPYLNKFDTIWKYKKSFLSGRIDFFTYLGRPCPICGEIDCYRQITPYWRYGIDLFPRFWKDRIPIARFLCRKEIVTFSLLPMQLIPYIQYTVNAVIYALLVGFKWYQMGRGGFFGASVEVDPDSDVTPYLIFCWLKVVLRGFRRAHRVVGRFIDLSRISTSEMKEPWEEVGGYFVALGLDLRRPWRSFLSGLLNRYGLTTTEFLFGTASQYRISTCP